MRLKELSLSGRLAASMCAATVLVALASAELLIQHSLGNTLAIHAERAKYTDSLLVSAMWGSMYEHVTEDASIAIVERWIADGADEKDYGEGAAEVMAEDCTNCHSRTSTMTEAVPKMPLTGYEDVKKLTVRGLPSGKLLGQVHTHMFALGVVLLVLCLLLALSDITQGWAVALTSTGLVGYGSMSADGCSEGTRTGRFG